jgi:hypothetical protein
MMKTGQVEKTSDRQYEVEERRYRTLESASLRLQKEAKGYLDSLRAMTASQMRIAETIDAFYGDSGATDGVSRSYKQAVEDLDAETVKALDGPYRCVPSDLRRYAWNWEKGVEDRKELRVIEWEMNRGARERFPGILRLDMDAYGELMDFIYRTTVLEPINRFCAYFPDINECKWRMLPPGCTTDTDMDVQVSRSETTRCSTTTRCAQKSRGLQRSPTRTRLSCRAPRRNRTWSVSAISFTIPMTFPPLALF